MVLCLPLYDLHRLINIGVIAYPDLNVLARFFIAYMKVLNDLFAYYCVWDYVSLVFKVSNYCMAKVNIFNCSYSFAEFDYIAYPEGFEDRYEYSANYI